MRPKPSRFVVLALVASCGSSSGSTATSDGGEIGSPDAGVDVGIASDASAKVDAPVDAPAESSKDAGAYLARIADEAAWIESAQLPDGAIREYPDPGSSGTIEPYFANLAALGLVSYPPAWPRVKARLGWYLSHLNTNDKWGLSGTMYDYTVPGDGGPEAPTNDADSTDSYAATLLSLARDYYEQGDAAARAYVASQRTAIEEVAGVIAATQQGDGMTWAKPDYPFEYLMDNCEVYRGLIDLAWLETNAWSDAAAASSWSSRASLVQGGIASLWIASGGSWAPVQNPDGTRPPADWTKWYPDAVAQVFPLIDGVESTASPHTMQVWSTLRAKYASWTTPPEPDGSPWALAGYAAALAGATTLADAYVAGVESAYTTKARPWPWQVAESGWFIRTNALLAQ